jgi:hypothetical protein
MSEFYINGVEIPKSTYNSFINENINKIFKILPIYEECLEKEDFKNYLTYIDKLIVMFTGSEILFNQKDFINLVSILKGMQNTLTLNKNQVKSIVFHCISILDKMKLQALENKD